MRCPPAICTVFLCLADLSAQQQEPNLVDRLLRPNMELQNDAQGKKFAANCTIVERRGTVGTFCVQSTRLEKKFTDQHNYSTQQYPGSTTFNSGSNNVVAVPNRDAERVAQLRGSGVPDIRSAHDAHNAVATREYAEGQRQFKGQGKSQKSLDRKNPTLTIDQVRELLNKNK